MLRCKIEEVLIDRFKNVSESGSAANYIIKLFDIPVPSRDVIYQTLPRRE
jgi:hypothetical protein